MNSNQTTMVLGDRLKPNIRFPTYTISDTNIDETYIFFKDLFYNTFEWGDDGKIILKDEKHYTIINYYDKMDELLKNIKLDNNKKLGTYSHSPNIKNKLEYMVASFKFYFCYGRDFTGYIKMQNSIIRYIKNLELIFCRELDNKPTRDQLMKNAPMLETY